MALALEARGQPVHQVEVGLRFLERPRQKLRVAAANDDTRIRLVRYRERIRAGLRDLTCFHASSREQDVGIEHEKLFGQFAEVVGAKAGQDFLEPDFVALKDNRSSKSKPSTRRCDVGQELQNGIRRASVMRLYGQELLHAAGSLGLLNEAKTESRDSQIGASA